MNKKAEEETCPLCKKLNSYKYCYAENRIYLHCKVCDLVYVSKSDFISLEKEKQKYDNHQNSPQDQGYVDFLNRLLNPLCSLLPQNAKGLDFGSGPGPTLNIIMKNNGYNMDIYDFFYHNHKSVFKNSYDFITTTEVIEHLHNPYDELQRLWYILKNGGYLGIMTAFRPKFEKFQNWYYKRDLTHIRFFTINTFIWLANELKAELIVPENGVVILKKHI
jgi:SAM-dependent methyltransferase